MFIYIYIYIHTHLLKVEEENPYIYPYIYIHTYPLVIWQKKTVKMDIIEDEFRQLVWIATQMTRREPNDVL